MAKVFKFVNRVYSIGLPDGPYYVGDKITKLKGFTTKDQDAYIWLYDIPLSDGLYIMHDEFTHPGTYNVKAGYRTGFGDEEWRLNENITVQSKQPEPVEIPYLTFTTEDKVDSIHITPADNWNATTKEYSTDNGATWQPYTSGAIYGITVKFRGIGGTIASGDHQWKVEPSTVDAVISGNIETVLDYQKVSQGQHPTLDENCFSSMFYGYTEDDIPVNLGIKSVKDLVIGSSDTILSKYCCQQMFDNCISLVDLPKLPAINLVMNCYYRMFEDCTNLKLAETVSPEYAIEFRVPVTGSGVTANNALGNMFKRISEESEFSGTPEINKTYYLFDYAKEIPSLTFTTEDKEDPVHITPSERWDATTCEYSIDNGRTWQTCTPGGEVYGLKVRFRGVGGTTASNHNYSWDVQPSNINAVISGNVEAVLDYQKVAQKQHPEIWERGFESMFQDCEGIKSIKNLTVGTSDTTLANGCCSRMFDSCTNLIDLPKLPAITLKNSCYDSMFQNCTSLKLSETASEEYTVEFRVPVEGIGVMANNALENMFRSISEESEFRGTPEINKTYYLC